jgi:hypothetical protein
MEPPSKNYYRNWVSGFTPSFKITTSTRRFCCRPAGVSLPASGYFFPYPRVKIRSELIPCFTNSSLTASARFSDRPRLYSSLPTLSVCPSINTFRSEYFFKNSASLLMVRMAPGNKFAFPVSNNTSPTVKTIPLSVCFAFRDETSFASRAASA